MALDWRKHSPKGGGLSVGDKNVVMEWDEGYDVLEFVPPANQPAWFGLVVDRPWLAPGNIHPTILSAYVTKFDAKPLGTSKGWTVTVSYRNGDPRELDKPPLLRRAKIDVSTESLEVPTLTKADGTPWINTAGDLLSGITKKKNRIIFAIQKNVAAVPAWSLNYADAVNSDVVSIRGLVCPAGYLNLGDLRIGDVDSEIVNGLNYPFIPISYTLTYDPDSWKTKVLNRGYYQIIAGKRLPIVDKKGRQVTEPTFLDENGLSYEYPMDPADIVTIEGWNHRLMPFGILPTV